MNKDKYSLLILLVVSCLPLTWFNGYDFISGGDFAFPLSGKQFIENTLYVWDSDIGTGVPAPRQVAFLVPFSLLSGLFEIIGLNQQILERVLFYFWFSLSGISAYSLCRYLKVSPIGSLSAGLFYMMNFYSMSIMWHIGGAGMITPAYVAFPLLVYLFLKVYYAGFKIKDTCIFLLVWFLLGSYMYANPALLIVHIFPLFIFILFDIFILTRERRGKVLFSISFLAILFVFLNAFWLFPFISDLSQEYKSVQHTAQGFISELDTFKLNSASLSDLFGTRGVWDVLGEYRGVYYHSWGPIFAKPFFVLLGYILTIISFIGFLKRNTPKIYLYFAGLYLIALFIIKGPNLPFGGLNFWIYEHVPFIMTAFRANIQKWGMVMFLALTPLLGYSISLIYQYSEKRFSSRTVQGGVIFFFIIFFVINVYPFWTDEVVRVGGKRFPGAKFIVPDSYLLMKEWDDKDKEESRILSLPITRNATATYQWGKTGEGEPNGFSGGDLIRWFVNRPVINMNRNSIENALVSAIEDDMKNKDVDYLKLMGMENIKYILLHNDWNWDFWKGHPWQFDFDRDKIESFLRLLKLYEPSKSINKVRSFGKLDLYKIPDQYFLPHIYPASGITLVTRMPAAMLFMPQSSGAKNEKSDIELLPDILSIEDENIRSGIFFSSQNEQRMESIKQVIKGYDFKEGILITQEGSKRIHLSPDIRTPIIEFKKINPTKYRIRVHNATEDFPLVFSESFHKGWKAYLVESGRLKVKSQDEILRQAQNDNFYKILDGNKEDQANKEELADYINKGWISDLGDGKEKEIKHKKYLENGKEILDHIEKYNIDFVSKNFKDTIQNDNLPKGKFYETWLASKLGSDDTGLLRRFAPRNDNVVQLPEEDHLIVNSYANSWWIDINKIKNQKSKIKNYVQNPDGSIDFELVLEFWPQRLFYIGLFISGLTLISCVLYLMLHSKNRVIGSRSLSRAEEIAPGTTSHRNGTVRNILLAIANKVRQLLNRLSIPFHLSPNKGLIIWGGIVSASLAFGIFQLIKDKTSGRESYWVTFSMIAFVVFYSYLFRKWRPRLEKKFPSLETYLPERLCAPYIAFAMLLLLFCALLLVFQLNPLAEQVANLVYFFLVWGVIKEAHSS